MFFLFCYIKVTKSQTKPLTSSSPLSKSQKTKLTLSAELYLYFDCHITVIMVGWRGGLNRRVISSVIRRSEWGYHDNLTTHLFFWFCSKKQLNFGHFTLKSGLFEEISEDCRKFPNEEVRPLPKTSEIPSKHSGFQVTRMIKRGKKKNPKKFVDQKLTPQNPWRISKP